MLCGVASRQKSCGCQKIAQPRGPRRQRGARRTDESLRSTSCLAAHSRAASPVSVAGRKCSFNLPPCRAKSRRKAINLQGRNSACEQWRQRQWETQWQPGRKPEQKQPTAYTGRPAASNGRSRCNPAGDWPSCQHRRPAAALSSGRWRPDRTVSCQRDALEGSSLQSKPATVWRATREQPGDERIASALAAQSERGLTRQLQRSATARESRNRGERPGELYIGEDRGSCRTRTGYLNERRGSSPIAQRQRQREPSTALGSALQLHGLVAAWARRSQMRQRCRTRTRSDWLPEAEGRREGVGSAVPVRGNGLSGCNAGKATGARQILRRLACSLVTRHATRSPH